MWLCSHVCLCTHSTLVYWCVCMSVQALLFRNSLIYFYCNINWWLPCLPGISGVNENLFMNTCFHDENTCHLQCRRRRQKGSCNQCSHIFVVYSARSCKKWSSFRYNSEWGNRPPRPTVHPHLCGWTTGGTTSKPKRYLRFRQDRARQRAVTSHTAQWWDVITAERTGRRPLELGGRVMLCERMQVGLSSSCPRVDWSEMARGEGAGHQHLPCLS